MDNEKLVTSLNNKLALNTIKSKLMEVVLRLNNDNNYPIKQASGDLLEIVQLLDEEEKGIKFETLVSK